MPHDTTLHIKLEKEMDERLKHLARARGKSKGQLVREAISACYQTSFEQLPLQQRQALAAYQGGYISLGRLAKVMGMHVLELRHWLVEHGIPERSVYGAQDAVHA